MNRTLPLMLLTAAALADPLATMRWTLDVETPDPRPYVATAVRGECIALECTLQNANLGGAGARFLWQTNGMDTAWWSAPATVSGSTVRAVWDPAMDSGAAAHQFAFDISNGPTSTLYRVLGTIRIRPGPGATPNEIALPVQTIDFATVTTTNAPWATETFVTNAIAQGGDYLPTSGADLEAGAYTFSFANGDGALTLYASSGYGGLGTGLGFIEQDSSATTVVVPNASSGHTLQVAGGGPTVGLTTAFGGQIIRGTDRLALPIGSGTLALDGNITLTDTATGVLYQLRVTNGALYIVPYTED